MGRRNKSGYETDTRRLTIFVINWIAHWLTSSTCSHTCFNTQTTRNVLDLDVTQTLMGTVWCKLISVARNSWSWSQTCRHNGMCWIIDSLTPHTHTHTVWSGSCDLGVAGERPSQWPHHLLPLYEGVSHCYHGDRQCECHGDDNVSTVYKKAYIHLLPTKLVSMATNQ